MKTTLLTVALACLGLLSKAQTTTTNTGPAKASSGGTFWHHSGEITVTPSTDYFIYAKGKDYEAAKPYEYSVPFIGFNISGQYMYRPVEVFAISAGLGFRMQGYGRRHTNYFLGNKYVDNLAFSHYGYLQVPIEFHLFKKMPHCTFEFATGPQFNFPVILKSTSTSYNADGDKISTTKSTYKFSTGEMKQSAALGWNIILGAEIHLASHADMFVGPQINFLDIAYFKKDINSDRRDFGTNYSCSLGLKLGFRIHCEE